MRIRYWMGCWALLGLLLAGCTEDDGQIVNKTDYGDTPPPKEVPSPGWEAEPAPPLDTVVLNQLRPADGFDYPVGPPDAEKYYKYRGFLPKDLEHLGEDWNGIGGGNTDMQDYVYAAADGVVFYSDRYSSGWGHVIRMVHNYGTESHPRYIETLYAHVASSWVKPGRRMKRGDVIGTIGDAEGKYHAHLHFEMRKAVGKEIRAGYAGDTTGFVDPTDFIEEHRPLRAAK